MLCIICREEKPESIEHIIPEALGNKKLITKRVCEECNNKLGSNVDDYFVNHPLVKILRANEGLTGKSGKEIKLFRGVEVDEKTGLKYDMKSGKPILMPRIILDEKEHIRIEASTKEAGMDYFRKIMKRKGISDAQIESYCKEAIIGEVNIKTPPEFKKDASIDFSRMGLAAIKIAYEYAFEIWGENYLNDEVAKLFSEELLKAIKKEKKDICVSDELARFVTFPINGSGIDILLENIRKNMDEIGMSILHTIFVLKQDNCLYCVLNLCMTDVISFAVKITEHADNYHITLPFTFVERDGNSSTW